MENDNEGYDIKLFKVRSEYYRLQTITLEKEENDNEDYDVILFKARSEHYRLRTIALEKEAVILRKTIKKKDSKLAKMRQKHQDQLLILDAQIESLEERFKKCGLL